MFIGCDLMPWIIFKRHTHTHRFNCLQISQTLCIYIIGGLTFNKSLKSTQRVNCASLSSRCLSLAGFLTDYILTVITSGHCSRNQDLAVSITPAKILCAVRIEALSQRFELKGCEGDREREEEGGGDSPLHQSSPVSLLWPSSFQRRQITAHC